VHNNIYLLLSYASFAIKYWCAHFTTLQTHWTGFTSTTPYTRQLKRCKRLGLCDEKLPSVAKLFSDADDKLFKTTLHNTHYVLPSLLTDRAELNYNLRSRTDNKSLITETSHLTDHDFIVCMLYKDSY